MEALAGATRKPTGVVVVADKVEHAGAVIWWTLHGTTPITGLVKSWEEAGLDHKMLPRPPSEGSCLRQAVQAQASKRFLARPLGRDEGWGLVQETVGADVKVLGHEMVYRAFIEGHALVVEAKVPGGWADDASLVVQSIRNEFERAEGWYHPGEIGSWLVARVGALNGVALRDTGGIYFLPHAQVPAWRAMAEALKAAAGHELYELPALRNQEGVRAIMAAVLAEARAAEEELARDLAEGKFGAKGLKNRASHCEAVAAKVNSYEEILGVTMGEITDRLGALRASLVEAALVAEKETEAS